MVREPVSMLSNLWLEVKFIIAVLPQKMIWPGIAPAIYHTPADHANQYAIYEV